MHVFEHLLFQGNTYPLPSVKNMQFKNHPFFNYISQHDHYTITTR